MMKIECSRGRVNKTGLIDFKWNAKFTFALKEPTGQAISHQFGAYVAELRRLTGIFSAFTSWLVLQADYPNEGLICSITLTANHLDENNNYLAGKIIKEMMESYRKVHPKVVCQSDK